MKKLFRAFDYIFSDNEWFNKVLIGGLYLFLVPFGIGMIMLNGFLAEFIAGQKKGDASMPYWRNYREIFRQGLNKSVFSLMAIGTLYLAFFLYGLHYNIPSWIVLIALFFTINTVQIARSFDSLSVVISFLLLIAAISVGWMWIVVGWPLLIFLALLVQASLFVNDQQPSEG